MGSVNLSLSLLLLLLTATLTLSDPTQDKQALLAFLSTTPHSTRLSWDPTRPTCDWVGVTCDPTQSFVTALRLPGMGLLGPIRPNTITNLTRLRVLSLRSNSLSGPLPNDLSSLSLLRSLYLQHNNLSGSLPPSLSTLSRLSRLDLSANRLSGTLPFSLNNLSRLSRLFLQNNSFSGNLPSLSQSSLVSFDVSNNNLNGSVPAALGRFPAAAFAGNLDLCGGPLKKCDFFPGPAPAPELAPADGKRRRKGLSGGAIAGIVVGAAVLLLLAVVVLVLCCRRRKGHVAKTPKNAPPTTTSRGIADVGTSSSIDVSGEGGGGERNKLVFFENGGSYSFDLEDLLRASAEVLGKGSVGTSYKAVLEEGTTVVVKRLKDVAVGKREFELQMEVLGKIKSEFVVPFRAYYFSKDEKLLVCDYMPAGSLSALLHGSRGSGRTPLDWENRIRIALSTARGLAHLHVSSNVVHGNLKASNILLRSDHDASLSDFGLNQIFGSSAPPNRVAGYRAPEIIETRHVTFKSDVYSFGVLVLELLTGKSPNQASLGEEGIDLPRWVQSVVREEWTAEVFDVELMRYHNIEEEMVQLLQIGMACVSIVPDQRPSMSEVVRMIEDINRGETDDGLRQSSDDPSKGSDGQTPPQRRSPPPLTP